MNDADLMAALEQQEEAYEDLVRTRASLGTMLAETIRRDRDLTEFGRHVRELPLLIRSADFRRTELKVELLRRQLKEAEEEHRKAAEGAKRSAAALEKAKTAYVQATNAERRAGLQARHLEELCREEMARLERLRSEEAGQEEEEKEEKQRKAVP
jgi:hypothetical protein